MCFCKITIPLNLVVYKHWHSTLQNLTGIPLTDEMFLLKLIGKFTICISTCIEGLHQLTIPLVLVEPRNPSIFPIDSVVSDDFYGGKLAVKHLLALGHRSIACIGTSEAYVTQLRFDGYRIALNDAEIAYQPELFVQVRSDLTVDEGRWAMQQLLERGVKFSAVLPVHLVTRASTATVW